jgi:hypothetical protein
VIRWSVVLLGLLGIAAESHASHPLLTEDTDVLGKGRWQAQLHASRSPDETELEPELAYGIAERVDVKVALPYVRERREGAGWGDASLTVKWRFHETERLALVFKPVLHLPGWEANLVGGYTIGRFEALAQLGYARQRDRPEEPRSVRHRSVALVWSAMRDLRLVLDGVSRTPAREIVYGVLYDITDDLDVGVGIKRGLNDVAQNREVLFGARWRW